MSEKHSVLDPDLIAAVVAFDDHNSDPIVRTAIRLIFCYFLKATMYEMMKEYKLSQDVCNHVALALRDSRISFEFIHETYLEADLVDDNACLSFGYYPLNKNVPLLPLKWSMCEK